VCTKISHSSNSRSIALHLSSSSSHNSITKKEPKPKAVKAEPKPKKAAAPKKDNSAYFADKAAEELVNSSCTIATDFADQTCTFSNKGVSDEYKEEWPSRVELWIPVKSWKARHSPQSQAACKALEQFYGSLDKAWEAGWRWMFQPVPQAHLWYPPQWVDETIRDLKDYKCLEGRNTKLCKEGKLSFMSTGVVPLLEIMNTIAGGMQGP
jgi:hypothetical protein